MGIEEFDIQFDVLYNNITSNQAPGLNAYEKSIFLTKAEKEIVKNHFIPHSKGNTLNHGYDDSPKRQIDFSILMMVADCTPKPSQEEKIYTFKYNGRSPAIEVQMSNNVYAVNSNGDKVSPTGVTTYLGDYTIDPNTIDTIHNTFKAEAHGITLEFHGLYSKIKYTTQGTQNNTITVAEKTIDVSDKIDSRSSVFTFPEDTFIIINEVFYTESNKILQVVPLKYDEYFRLMSKPFKRPLKNQAWRLINSGKVEDGKGKKYVEIITPYGEEEGTYKVRYLRTPKPIILEDLENGLTIDGEDGKSLECEIDPILHDEILQRAVELAKIAWQGDLTSAIQMGQRSE